MAGRKPKVDLNVQLKLFKSYMSELKVAKSCSDDIYLKLSTELQMSQKAVFLAVKKYATDIFGTELSKKETEFPSDSDSDLDSDFDQAEFGEFDKKFTY